MRWRAAGALLAAAALTLTACAGAPAAPRVTTVFAAASLQGAFTRLAGLDPSLRVRFSFEGSSSLVDQLAGGARADVLATADERTMRRAVDGELVTGTPAAFATNHLVLVTPPGNPARVTGLDSSLAGRKLVVCSGGVPCGTATRTLASRLGVRLTPVSEEQKVTDVLGKVTSGEADAGVVYRTDAAAAGARVETMAIPGAEKVVNRYLVAAVAGAPDAGGARRFVELVRSERGRQVLASYGFGAP